MNNPPLPPAAASSPSPEEPTAGSAALEPVAEDFVFARRARSAGEFLAGLMAGGQLATVGTPRKLPADIWPDVDPAVVQEIYNRGAAAGFHAGRTYPSSWLRRDELARLQEELRTAGFEAMGAMVGRSLRLVTPSGPDHPADGEPAREHGAV